MFTLKHCIVMKMNSSGDLPQNVGEEKHAKVNPCPRCGTKVEKEMYYLNGGRKPVQPVGSPATIAQTPCCPSAERITAITPNPALNVNKNVGIEPNLLN